MTATASTWRGELRHRQPVRAQPAFHPDLKLMLDLPEDVADLIARVTADAGLIQCGPPGLGKVCREQPRREGLASGAFISDSILGETTKAARRSDRSTPRHDGTATIRCSHAAGSTANRRGGYILGFRPPSLWPFAGGGREW